MSDSAHSTSLHISREKRSIFQKPMASNGRPRPRPGSAAAASRPRHNTLASPASICDAPGGDDGGASATPALAPLGPRRVATSAGRTRTTPAAAVITTTKAPGAKLVSVGSSLTLHLGARHEPTLPPRTKATLARSASKQGWRPPVARDLVGVDPWEVRRRGVRPVEWVTRS